MNHPHPASPQESNVAREQLLYEENVQLRRLLLHDVSPLLGRSIANTQTLFGALANEFRALGKHEDADALLREREAEQKLLQECLRRIRNTLGEIGSNLRSGSGE